MFVYTGPIYHKVFSFSEGDAPAGLLEGDVQAFVCVHRSHVP